MVAFPDFIPDTTKFNITPPVVPDLALSMGEAGKKVGELIAGVAIGIIAAKTFVHAYKGEYRDTAIGAGLIVLYTGSAYLITNNASVVISVAAVTALTALAREYSIYRGRVLV